MKFRAVVSLNRIFLSITFMKFIKTLDDVTGLLHYNLSVSVWLSFLYLKIKWKLLTSLQIKTYLLPALLEEARIILNSVYFSFISFI